MCWFGLTLHEIKIQGPQWIDGGTLESLNWF